MPTEYDLEYAVKLEAQSKFESLYKWSIQEFDGEGRQVGPDFIPFSFGVNFFATELRFDEGALLDTKAKRGDETEETEVKHCRTIRASLCLGHPQEEAFLAPSLSYFGTKRNLERISLTVRATEEDETEACWLDGGPAFGTLDGERFDDMLEIQMVVTPSTFEALAARIRERSVDIANLRLSRVAGLYSEWTPDVRVSHLKLLTKPENHQLNLAEAGSIEPRSMGVVKEASLWFHSLQTFNAHEVEDDLDDVASENGVAVSMAPLPVAPKLDTKEITKRLKQIGWLLTGIFLVLVAMLFR